VREHRPDVVPMDIQTPEMDGITADHISGRRAGDERAGRRVRL
jgi:CheY-like chemotaxis protein